MIIEEIQMSVIYDHACLEACLKVPTKGTLVCDNGDCHPNTFRNT